MTKLEQKINDIIEPIINNLNYEVYDVIYEKNVLSIFIDKKEGSISINDCEKVNDAITDILDEKDLIKGQYNLEVSSPGLERKIRSSKQLKENINNEIKVNLFKSISINEKKFNSVEGILKAFDDDNLEIEVEENKNNKDSKTIVSIDRKNISKINTVFNFEA